MPGCWAEVLGGCSSKISREHAISRNQFGDVEKITVQGFPWCPQPKEIGLAKGVEQHAAHADLPSGLACVPR